MLQLKDLSKGTNAPMMYPWCRCSIAATTEEISKDMFNYNPKEELDRKQYNKYKDILRSDIGLTFDDFKDMKYNGSKKWNKGIWKKQSFCR